jgi:uncharacterized protein YjbI with pentapeptide repeats
MPDTDQLLTLKHGLQTWNHWREENPSLPIDLANADLRNIDLSLHPSLREAQAKGIFANASWSFIVNEIVGYDVFPLNLSRADLRNAKFDGADLQCTNFSGADLSGASLRGALLGHANLSNARLVNADLSHCQMRAADLSQSVLIKTNLTDADLGSSRVYGVSVWDTIGCPRDEKNLIVTSPGDASLSTDSLALAQFLYFLIRNENAREMIDTLTTKVVLILGNFKKENKDTLEAIRDKLRTLGLIPVLFDFNVPASKDTTGTVETLARISRFILADLTDPSSIPHELATTVPFLKTTPVLLLRQAGTAGYSMVNDLLAYPWVLPVHEYLSPSVLVQQLSAVIAPACSLSNKLQHRNL